jgi:hypothetical protein
MDLVGIKMTRTRSEIFVQVSALAGRHATRPPRDRATIPYLNEPWYC